MVGAYKFVGGPSITSRLDVWTAATKLFFKENIIMGFGLGHWQYISKTYLKEAYETIYFHRAHNTFIQCWFELGFLFIFVLGGYCARLYKQVKNNQIFIFALIAIAITCSVNSVFRMNSLNGLIIIVWLATIERSWREQRIRL